MRFSVVTPLALSLALSTVHAAPAAPAPNAKRQDCNVRLNEQNCMCMQNTLALTCNYHLNIGVPYNAGSGCQSIQDRLQGALVGVTVGPKGIESFGCSDDGYGNTALGFSAQQNRADVINGALALLYPTVNGFNCPDS